MKMLRQLEQLLELRKLRFEIAETALAHQAGQRDDAERQFVVADRQAAEQEKSYVQCEASWLEEIARSPASHTALNAMIDTMTAMAFETAQLRTVATEAEERLASHAEVFASKSQTLRLKRRDWEKLGALTGRQQERARRRLEAQAEQDEEEFAARRHSSAGYCP
ncbi:hypothetical protein IB262_33220 [Ensifer sp. ENS02]|uniref:hypothetical protein n=1 Tax=Ensifer sp. ENS02 TaxID=2769290 RepID=UPI00177DF232|nr:hypothetical protein [Ensifer sp. ENS02]MBD9524739.1 hypothetical protein [Ensifer sp. ENS02]